MRTTLSLAAGLIIMSLGWRAAAQPGQAADAPDAAIPGFATMDRVDAQSHFGVSSSLAFFKGDDPNFNNRLDLYGQYVAAAGVGGYASLPLSFIFDEQNASSPGNLELGGLYVAQTGHLPIVLHGSVLLPTAGDEDEDIIANFATVNSRLTDFAGIFPESTWLRLAASPMYRRGNVFVRVDAGLDVPLDTADGADIDPLVRLNLGGGVMAGSLAFLGELVTIGTTGDVDDEDRFLHTLALGVRAMLANNLQPYAAAIVPIGREETGFIDVNFALMAGLQIALGR